MGSDELTQIMEEAEASAVRELNRAQDAREEAAAVTEEEAPPPEAQA